MKKLFCTLVLCICCAALLAAAGHASAEPSAKIKFHDVLLAMDAEEIDISGVELSGTEEVEAILPQFPNLKKVVMCDCGIPNETMAELNDKYEEIRFVWRVQLGALTARTDDTWFAPVTVEQSIWADQADNLKYCIDMECIDLGHMRLPDCNWAANMPHLKYLILADNYLMNDLTPLANCKELAFLEVFLTDVRDYSPLLGCTALENLNISYTQGDPATLAGMDQVTHLWWAGSFERYVDGVKITEYLNELLPNAEIHTEQISSTGAGWRHLPNYYAQRDIIGMWYMDT